MVHGDSMIVEASLLHLHVLNFYSKVKGELVGGIDLGEDVEGLAGSPKIYFFKVASDAKI